MSEHWKWKKVGQRRSDLDKYWATAAAQNGEEHRKASLALAHQRWRDGKLYPWRITLALDYGGHEGPEVDVACGVAEPCVDMWEDGHLYPTWEQLLKLAELTGFQPVFFTIESGAPRFEQTSLAHHTKPKDWPAPPVLEFLPEAYEAIRRTSKHKVPGSPDRTTRHL